MEKTEREMNMEEGEIQSVAVYEFKPELKGRPESSFYSQHNITEPDQV